MKLCALHYRWLPVSLIQHFVYFQTSAVAKHFVALSTNAVSTGLCQLYDILC